MECSVEKFEHFRHILLFEFNRGAKAAEAARNICAVYGDNTIGESTARKWFSRLDISDIPRSGRPSGFEEDRLNTLIHNDPSRCSRELANVMNCYHSTIVRHFYWMGKVQKSCVWVPHALSQNHKNLRVAICTSLLARHRLFLSIIVTGDEKWCLYANIRKKRNCWAQTRGECVGNVPISPLGTPFSNTHISIHCLKMTKLQYLTQTQQLNIKHTVQNKIIRLLYFFLYICFWCTLHTNEKGTF